LLWRGVSPTRCFTLILTSASHAVHPTSRRSLAASCFAHCVVDRMAISRVKPRGGAARPHTWPARGPRRLVAMPAALHWGRWAHALAAAATVATRRPTVPTWLRAMPPPAMFTPT
jgi:hypothetical protein